MESLEDHPLKGSYFEERIRSGLAEMMTRQRAALGEAMSRGKGGGPAARSRSGQLMDSLSRPASRVMKRGATVSADIDYLLVMRFMDIRRLGDMRIYNRPVWGYLYGELFPDMRHGFRDWLRKALGNDLRTSLAVRR